MIRKIISFVKHKLSCELIQPVLWSRRNIILCCLIIFFLTPRVLNYLWYLQIPKDEPSILCSFGKGEETENYFKKCIKNIFLGRLGNQMSSVATMFSFAKKFGFRYFVTQDQFDQLSYYFKPESLGLSVMEHSLPHYHLTILGHTYSRLHWDKPWDSIDDIDNNYDYKKIDDEDLHTGRALNVGDFPNDVKRYREYLAVLRERFTLQDRFRERAQDLLQSELMRRNMAGSDITWVGVHNRRGDYGVDYILDTCH